MLVTGLVVTTVPEELQAVLVAIENVKQVSITRMMDENKILAIIDTENSDEETVISEKLRKIDGVISVSLAYHHSES